MAYWTSNACSAASRWRRRIRATCWRWPHHSRDCRRCAARWSNFPAAAFFCPLRELLDELRDVRERIERTIVARAAGHAQRWRRDRKADVDAAARRTARHQPQQQALDRADRAARARAHRHQLAQGKVQQRLRLLHRDQQVEPAYTRPPTTSASRLWSAPSASLLPS